jgi:DNA-binding response OmpR family regulator
MGPVIAVVDDDPAFCKLLFDSLTGAGYLVVLATTGSRAYRLIQQAQPALAILDLRLDHPEGGWVLLNVLRRDPATAHLPIIVCSGDLLFLDAIVDQLPERRCAILEKPFDLADLLLQIERLLSRTGSDLDPPSQQRLNRLGDDS